jgi:mannose-6-phosphate isomerase
MKKRVIKFDERPWGNFKQFTFNEISTVKVISVKPHQKLSLQYHFKRDEMWYFITDGYMILGDKELKKKKGEVEFIPKKVNHRLFSCDKEVQVLEISFGEFDEKDIVRLEDSYGRK